MTDIRIKQAIDSNLSAVHVSQRHVNKIIDNITEGKKVKKKLSVAFVLMLVLSLAIVTALAVTTLTDYFSGYAKLGGDYGLYSSEWPTSAKVELVQLMLDSAMNIDQEKAEELLNAELSEEEQEALADEILGDHFGQYTDLLTLMENQWNEVFTWTYEQKALYTSLMEQYDLSLGEWGNDLPRYLLPEESDVQLDEAIPIAKAAILAAYDVAGEELKDDEMNVGFVQSEEYGEEPVWVIEFRYQGSHGNLYTAIVTRNGTVYSVQAPNTQPIIIGQDTLEGAIPAEIHEYDISEEQAVEIAREVLMGRLGYTQEEADACEAGASFFFHERYRQGKQPVWLVTLTPADETGIKVLLSYEGEFIDWAYADKEFTNVQTYGFEPILGSDRTEELYDEEGFGFYHWSLEEKAAFSEEWIPIVEAFAEKHPYFTREGNSFWLFTRRVYGLPTEEDITQDEALSIALDETKQLGATNELIKVLTWHYFFFDVTDPDQPLWLVVLTRESDPDLSKEERLAFLEYFSSQPRQYFIIIDAHNGTVVESHHSDEDEYDIRVFLDVQ